MLVLRFINWVRRIIPLDTKLIVFVFTILGLLAYGTAQPAAAEEIDSLEYCDWAKQELEGYYNNAEFMMAYIVVVEHWRTEFNKEWLGMGFTENYRTVFLHFAPRRTGLTALSIKNRIREALGGPNAWQYTFEPVTNCR